MGSVEEMAASSSAATVASLASFPTATFTGVDQSAPFTTPLVVTPVAPPAETELTAMAKLGHIYTEQREQQKTVKDLKESLTRLEQLLLTTMSNQAVPTSSATEKEAKPDPKPDPKIDPAESFWEWDGTYRTGPKDPQGPQTNQWSEEEWTEWKKSRPKRNDYSARHLDEKNFRRVEKFSQGDSEWQEFCFDVMVTTRSINPDLASQMEDLTKAKKVDSDHYEDLYQMNPEMLKASSELYEVLCQLTGGQAKSLMRGIDKQDGLKAWRNLHTTYARETLARTLRLYREVINPSQASNPDQIITSIGRWETKLKELERGTTTRLPEMVKLAALTEICTNDIRDLVYQHADDGQTFEQIREKVIGWTSNRIAANAANMDVGNVDAECTPCEDGANWFEVNYMTGKCYNCGQTGHPARLCTNKGKGKGKGGPPGKGFGKGGGKYGGTPFTPNYPGGQGNQKGMGKGYQGSCFTCGQKGHKAAECQARRTNNVEAEEEADTGTKEIGGIWLMGHVGKVVETHNRFSHLEQSEAENEDEEKWKEVTGKKGTKLFDGRSRINLTTRNLKGSLPKLTGISKPRMPTVSGGTSESPGKVIAAVEKVGTGDELPGRLIAAANKVQTGVCQMTFHITDATKMLASVNKMTEAGNEVHFNRRRSYIESPTGKRASLRKRGGVYVLDVVFFDGETAVKGEVIVDSGAADNVMPRGILTGVLTREKEPGSRFVAADGGELGNYGRKDIQFCPLEFWEDEFGSPFQGQTQ
jgi:hypothetical protein